MHHAFSTRLQRVVLAALALPFAIAVHAQQFPNKPIRFVVPFPPGGGNDLLARMISPKMSEALGQPVVIDNRAGASGQVGTQLVARAAPDGYTIVTTGTPFTISQTLIRNMPYDALADFTPISLMVLQPNVLVANPEVPAKTLPELIALAKAQPGKLNYGTGSTGSAPHLASELLKTMARIDVVHIPYNGAAPALKAVLAGEVAFIFDNPATSMPHIRAGKIRALGVTGKTRAPQLPEVPTIAEAGLPGYEVNSWFGVIGPAGIPGPIAERLSVEIAKALKTAEVQERLTQQGFSVVGSSPEEFRAFLKADVDNFRRIIESSGVKIQTQ
jgi:tripartite-type tricarboxylate transporter receptor subunit TctC